MCKTNNLEISAGSRRQSLSALETTELILFACQKAGANCHSAMHPCGPFATACVWLRFLILLGVQGQSLVCIHVKCANGTFSGQCSQRNKARWIGGRTTARETGMSPLPLIPEIDTP
eukprot:COSAG02_NODE_1015_length_15191_cov_6.937450_9_plen_117_part_00